MKFRGPLIILFLTCSTFAFSQQPLLSIFGGPQISSARYRISDVKQPTDHKTGFQAGMGIKIPFETNLFFSPAVFYSLKGYKVQYNRYSDPPDINAVDNATTIHTLELAALLQLDLGSKPTHAFLKLGPSLDLQIKGREKFKLMNGTTVDRSMLYDFGKYGHYCGNLIVQFGLETRGFLLFGQYSHGLANLNNADNGPDIKYRVFGLSLGKVLGRGQRAGKK